MIMSLSNNVFKRLFVHSKCVNVGGCVYFCNNFATKSAATPKKIAKKIGFIGNGNMAKAICRSIVNKGVIEFPQVYASSPYVNNLDIWKSWGANVTTDNSEVATETDVIFLAVKPHILNEAIDAIIASPYGKTIKNKLFVSILAGFTIKELEEVLKRFVGLRLLNFESSALGCQVSEGNSTI